MIEDFLSPPRDLDGDNVLRVEIVHVLLPLTLDLFQILFLVIDNDVVVPSQVDRLHISAIAWRSVESTALISRRRHTHLRVAHTRVVGVLTSVNVRRFDLSAA